jgi:hypothetical protein
MTNPTLGTQGSDLLDDSCDPFAKNARRVTSNPTPFTANRALGLLFSVVMAIAVALGAWAGLYFVTNKDYDFKFRTFSEDVGAIAGLYAVKANAQLREGVAGISSLKSLASPGGLAGLVKGATGAAGDAASAAATGAVGTVPGLKTLASFVPKA